MTLKQKILLYLSVFIAAYGAVFLLDNITTEYEAGYLRGETDVFPILQGDQSNYVRLAEDAGISDGDVLGPFAYRIIPAMLAYIIAAISNSDVIDGYHIMTFFWLGLELVMCFVLARELGANIWQSFFVMLIVALTLGNVRLMTYDYIRPDAVALTWVLAVIYLILRGHLRVAMLISWIGMIVREYFVITAGIISVYYLWQAYQIYRDAESKQQIWKPLAYAFLSALGVVLVFWIPRLLIEVPVSYQFLETTEESSTWEGFLFILQSAPRNKNYIMSFVGYMFPSILVFSVLRFRSLLPDLKRVILILMLYSLGIMALGYIGGTDLIRYASYMVVAQIILVVLFLRHGVMWWELVYLVIFWGWYNRVHLSLPGLQDDMHGYLVFVSPWGMSVPIEVSTHFKQAVVMIVILWGIRLAWYGVQHWRQSRLTIHETASQ